MGWRLRARGVGLGVPVKAELPVDAADDDIEAAEHVVRIVERAVTKDIGLDALEDTEAAAERCVEAIDLSLLLLDFLDGEPAGVMRRFGVIGDTNILVAVGEAGLTPLLPAYRRRPRRYCGRAERPIGPRPSRAAGSRAPRLARSRPGLRAAPVRCIAARARRKSRLRFPSR